MWRYVDKSKVFKEKDKKVGSGTDGLGIQSSFDMCGDIASAAINAQGNFKRSRTSAWRTIFNYGVSGLVGDILGRSYPAATASAVYLAQEYIDARKRQTEISVLAFAWNSYNCSASTVTAGRVIDYNAGPGYGPGRTLQCEDRTVQISFDGGTTWYSVIANVCEYRSPP